MFAFAVDGFDSPEEHCVGIVSTVLARHGYAWSACLRHGGGRGLRPGVVGA